MLNLIGKSKIFKSQEFPVVAGQSIIAEGLCLIQTITGGVEYVGLSAGGAAEIFAGVSYGEVFTPVTKVAVEEFVIPASLTVTLLHDVITNTQCCAYDVTTPIVQVIGAPGANQYSVVGPLLTFDIGKLGVTMRVLYRYVPSAEELVAMDNMRITSFSASDYIGSIGVIQKGEIYTDKFDVRSDWYNPLTLTVETGTAGYFDFGGGVGTLISNAVITHKPTVAQPYLGLRLK